MGFLMVLLGCLAAAVAAGDVLGMHSLREPDGMDPERLAADNMMMINGIAAMGFGLVMVW